MGKRFAGEDENLTLSAIIACLWVLASAITAMLPMQRQYAPGVALLIAAPVLIVWLAYDYGWWFGVIGLFAFVSMFRNPLKYFLAKARGQEPALPDELKKEVPE